MSEEHRFNKKQFLLRLNENVYDILNQKAKAACMKKTAFLTELIITGYVIKFEPAGIKELSDEINKIGVNINQVVHHINARGGGASQDDLNYLEERLLQIEEMIYQIAWGKEI